MTTELLLISAVKFEADPVLSILQKYDIPYSYYELGIGPINAAKNSISIAIKAKGKRVVYLGSAGTFSSFREPYLCQVDQVFWLPTGERMGLAKYMKGLHKPLSIPVTQHFDLPIKKVLTSTSVSLANDIVIEGLPAKQQLLENMEAYVLTEELMGEAKSIDIIFGITNEVGPNGSAEWFANFKGVAQLTADYLESKISKLKELAGV